jgi:hypothetical protein
VWHQILAIVGLLVLVAVGIPLWRRQQRGFKAHNDEMQAWAASHGCSFAAEDNSQFDGYTFYPFGRSERQHADRVITGTYAERPIAVYDFWYSSGGGGAGDSGASNVYFAMIVMDLPAKVPWLQVSELKHLGRHGDDGAIDTGDAAFDSTYGLFATDQAYAKSAMSATVKAGLPAQSISGMRIVDGRLFLWRTRRRHDVALLDDRLRFAATVAAELPASV